jgi:hypothetical protein
MGMPRPDMMKDLTDWQYMDSTISYAQEKVSNSLFNGYCICVSCEINVNVNILADATNEHSN